MQNYVSRDEFKQQKALEEARKLGKIPALKDEEGKDINPHMPQYITQAPWYLNQNKPSLNHQKWFQREEKDAIDTWYARGQRGTQATSYRKGACENCGAMTHKLKDCCEKPRKVGAKHKQVNIQADEIIVNLDLSYDGKRDRWNGYDPDQYKQIIEESELYELERKRRIQKNEEATDNQNLDDDYKQKDFEGAAQNALNQERDPKTKTMSKDLRIREDQAKYLLNLGTNSAFFDPKSRALRGNPNPDLPPEEQQYKGENYIRLTGDTNKMLQQERYAWEREDQLKINMATDPTMMEKTFKKATEMEKVKKQQIIDEMTKIYGGSEHLKKKEELARIYKENFLNGEDDAALVQEDMRNKESIYFVDTKVKQNATIKSKYPEDIFINNHISVWGSWYNDVLGWGYQCCHSNDKHSFCEGKRAYKMATIREYHTIKAKQESLQKFDELADQSENIVELNEQDQKEKQEFLNKIEETIAKDNKTSRPIIGAAYKNDIEESGNDQNNNQNNNLEKQQAIVNEQKDNSQTNVNNINENQNIIKEQTQKNVNQIQQETPQNQQQIPQIIHKSEDKKMQIEGNLNKKINKETTLQKNKKKSQSLSSADSSDSSSDDSSEGSSSSSSSDSSSDSSSNSSQDSDAKLRKKNRKAKQQQAKTEKKHNQKKKTQKADEKTKKHNKDLLKGAKPFQHNDEYYKEGDLNKKKLKKELIKEEQRNKQAQNDKDDRKRKYNVIKQEDFEITKEKIEAYRMKKSHFEDPMSNFK